VYESVFRGARTCSYISPSKECLEELIRSGSLPPGTKLPSSRTLARILGVSRNSVLEAYELLSTEGIVEAYGTAGTYVSEAYCARVAPIRLKSHLCL